VISQLQLSELISAVFRGASVTLYHAPDASVVEVCECDGSFRHSLAVCGGSFRHSLLREELTTMRELFDIWTDRKKVVWC
jgi:1,6-anhydro-N-acetylmuramate kinase